MKSKINEKLLKINLMKKENKRNKRMSEENQTRKEKVKININKTKT